MKRSSIATGIILAASLALSATGSARAEIFKYDDMIRGITTTRAQCTAHPQALWLNVDQRDFCVRYYISSVGGTGASPVVFLQGDYFGSVNANTDTWQWLDPADDKNIGVTYEPFRQDINANDLLSQADAFSKTARTTAIYLARIGVRWYFGIPCVPQDKPRAASDERGTRRHQATLRFPGLSSRWTIGRSVARRRPRRITS